ncbi:hypothetical protein H5410_030124 [Solanum commersonii]|uniref:Uncharacterized protein n=1 Tax=Solanum commersonii TaxID=4109 RepID=A0A9J5YEU6_SOLCO|nr:hypothetical protein H5410_030124 [Solanum commersonii]
MMNFAVVTITENKNGYESRHNDIELQQILFYSTQFHSGKNFESSSNHGVEVQASPIVIDFPFMDCMGTLVDDLREYPIRACPECWRFFCVNCKFLHLGMTLKDEEEEEEDEDDEGEEEERG